MLCCELHVGFALQTYASLHHIRGRGPSCLTQDASCNAEHCRGPGVVDTGQVFPPHESVSVFSTLVRAVPLCTEFWDGPLLPPKQWFTFVVPQHFLHCFALAMTDTNMCAAADVNESSPTNEDMAVQNGAAAVEASVTAVEGSITAAEDGSAAVEDVNKHNGTRLCSCGKRRCS